MTAPSCNNQETQSPEVVDEPAVEVSEPQAPVEQEVAPAVAEPVAEPAAEAEKPTLRNEQGYKMNIPQSPKF